MHEDAGGRIAAIAREAGHRSKIAVRSTVPGINAKGACIGPMGARVRAVMTELHGEKIDIVDFSEDPRAFVAAALSPSRRLRLRSLRCLLARSRRCVNARRRAWPSRPAKAGPS